MANPVSRASFVICAASNFGSDSLWRESGNWLEVSKTSEDAIYFCIFEFWVGVFWAILDQMEKLRKGKNLFSAPSQYGKDSVSGVVPDYDDVAPFLTQDVSMTLLRSMRGTRKDRQGTVRNGNDLNRFGDLYL
jgi:hypothetical protein